MPSTNTKPNLRNTRVFREELLAALGVTDDLDVENEQNFKSALLNALNVDHDYQDIANFEAWREKLIDAALNISEGGGGGGSSDFSTAEVTININATGYNPIAIVNNAIRQIIISETGTYTIPLYKGVAILPFPPDNLTEPPVFTGDIELSIEDTGVKVTGDGTITLVGSVS